MCMTIFTGMLTVCMGLATLYTLGWNNSGELCACVYGGGGEGAMALQLIQEGCYISAKLQTWNDGAGAHYS